MSALETLPVYFTPAPNETGGSLGIDFASYRRLAKTALALIRHRPLTLGLYRLANGEGCGLDVFGPKKCVSILVNSTENELALFVCGMDAPFSSATCVLSAENSDERSWRRLLRLAKQEIKA